MNSDPKLLVNKHFLAVTFFLCLVYLVFEAYYFYFLSVDFNYIGFKWNFSFEKYIESKILFSVFIFLSYWLFYRSRFLYSIFILLLLFFYIPNAIMFAFMNHIRGPLYSIALLLTLFLAISPVRIKIKTFHTTSEFRHLLAFSISLLLFIPIYLKFGFNVNWKLLLLSDIYETRDVFSANLTGLLDYFYNWQVKTIIPIVLVFFLIHKRFLLAYFATAILIYLYVISGNKIVYLTTIVTLFFSFVGKNYIMKIKYILFFILLMLAVFPIIDSYFLNGVLLRGIFVMRTFFFPALLNYCYFDYFSELHLYFSENHFFNYFFVSPLQIKSPFLISQVYFHTKEMYANNGIISDGFMNLGYAGVLLLSTFFCLIFLFFNSIQMDNRYFGIFFILIFFFLSAPLFTVLMTGGVWLLVLFSLIIMKKPGLEGATK